MYSDFVHQIQPEWDRLSSFVNEVCKDREESHGHNHMKTVAESSFDLLYQMKEQYPIDSHFLHLVAAVAWLHDVNDHKYDFDGTLSKKVNKFLEDTFSSKDAELIFRIIDRISYSKENTCIKENKKLDWEDVLGEVGLKIRNLVSDADKLEALGKIGFERCVQYSKEIYQKKHGTDMSLAVLFNAVEKHAIEKLYRLKDEFIRTEAGKKKAELLHEVLIKEIKKLELEAHNNS